ncbi:MAG: hypothetical protein ACRDTD_01125 [Pseudonocardiaceae bacterium]
MPRGLAPPPGLRSGSQVCLPSEVEELLSDVVADGFALYCCGDRAAPSALVVHPAHPDAPTSAFPAPSRLHIPRAEQRLMTIRLPSPGRADARGIRLATAMASEDSGLVKGAAGLSESAGCDRT